MKTQKIKRYRLGVSTTFPSTHKRKGEKTFFKEQIEMALGCRECETEQDLSGRNISNCNSCHNAALLDLKIHTIRSNYPLWEKRMKKVQEGNAVIELFYWSGKPYHSKQIVFATLDKDSECGVQELIFLNNDITQANIQNTELDEFECEDYKYIAKNDGLSIQDFKDWFKSYDLSKPMAIIHFTKFRY